MLPTLNGKRTEKPLKSMFFFFYYKVSSEFPILYPSKPIEVYLIPSVFFQNLFC